MGADEDSHKDKENSKNKEKGRVKDKDKERAKQGFRRTRAGGGGVREKALAAAESEYFKAQSAPQSPYCVRGVCPSSKHSASRIRMCWRTQPWWGRSARATHAHGRRRGRCSGGTTTHALLMRAPSGNDDDTATASNAAAASGGRRTKTGAITR